MPAVKLGRLATDEEWARRGIGMAVLDYMKYWFVNGNKTGCRFIVVDAYNNKDTLNFYEKNDFEYLLTDDTEDKTRLMIFDLSRFQIP